MPGIFHRGSCDVCGAARDLIPVQEYFVCDACYRAGEEPEPLENEQSITTELEDEIGEGRY